MHTNNQSLKNEIIQQSDLCVKCGMCASQCPTYLIKQDENESPRGRIALAQAYASNILKDSKTVTAHIDSCLGCMRCEKVCPSKVPYQEILNNTKIMLSRESLKGTRLIKLLSHLNTSQWKVLGSVMRTAQKTGLAQVFTFLFAKKYFNYLRPVAAIPPLRLHDESVQLFTGCISHIFDQTSLSSLVTLLDACNVTAQIPDRQKCCGALASHRGLLTEAEECRISNETSFKNNLPILFSTSGCGAHLNSYRTADTQSAFFQLEEAGQFLLKHKNFSQLDFAPLDKTVLVHSPCSEKNVLKKASSLELLKSIPQIKLSSLAEAVPCCGAAGSYMLEYPAESALIREFTLDAITQSRPDILVSTNYPCAMHIAAGLKQKGLDIEVMHPLRLLHQQLIQR